MRVTWDPGKRPEGLRDPDDWDLLHLKIIRDQHDAADHGVHAIEAIVYCYESRIALPQWLLDWLGSNLATWLDAKGISLDKALSVQSPGPGHSHPLKRLELQRERSDAADNIFLLNHLFKISVDDAAEMVKARNESNGRPTPDAGWLAESYRKHWRKELSAETRASLTEMFEDEGYRRDFLASFPPAV